MGFKKLGLIFLMLLMTLVSVNAVTQLTSCGKTSGWLSDEVYEITFSEIPVTYTTAQCFYISNAGLTNMTFIQTQPQIDINGPNLAHFFKYYSAGSNTGGNYENFNLNINQNTAFNFLNSNNPSSFWSFNYLSNSNFNNITINSDNGLVNKMFDFYATAGSGPSGTYANEFILNDITLNDAYLIKIDLGWNGGSIDMYVNNWNIDNLLLNYITSPDSMGYLDSDINTFLKIYLSNWVMNNSIIMVDSNIPFTKHLSSGTYSNNKIYSSTIQTIFFDDTDDNNIGDISSSNWGTDTQFFIENPSIFVVDDNDYYIQDIEESFDLIDNIFNKTIYPVNDDGATFNEPLIFNNLLGGNVYDCNYISLLGMETQSIFLRSGITIQNCNLVSSSDVTGLSYNAGDISFKGLGKIINNSITKTGLQDSTLIRDEPLVTTIALQVEGNIIKSTSTGLTDMKFIESNAQLTNRIANNNFDVLGDSVVSYISFLSDTSSVITENIFANSFSFTNTYVFKDNSLSYANTMFYNNKIYDGDGLSLGVTNVNLNTLYAYEHTDNKIYFFNIGNYYTGNTGCVDSDLNGVCDSAYVFDSVTDDYPLAVYPFDFVSHLLTADYVVNNDAFNTSFVNVIDYEQVNLTTLSDSILVEYQHTSTFPDIQCDYWVNGVNVVSAIDVPNTLQNFTYGTWVEGINTIFINCYNGYQSSTTGVFHLNITLPLEVVLGCTDTEANNYNPLATTDDGSCAYDGEVIPVVTGTDIIDFDSIENTNTNAGNFLADVGSFIVSVGTPLAIIITVIVLMFAVVRLIY